MLHGILNYGENYFSMKTTTTIKLDDQFTVQADPHCWILARESFGETNPKTGKPKRSSGVSYHPDLRTALITYLDLCSKASTEVLEVLESLSTAERNIEVALENLKDRPLRLGND